MCCCRSKHNFMLGNSSSTMCVFCMSRIPVLDVFYYNTTACWWHGLRYRCALFDLISHITEWNWFSHSRVSGVMSEDFNRRQDLPRFKSNLALYSRQSWMLSDNTGKYPLYTSPCTISLFKQLNSCDHCQVPDLLVSNQSLVISNQKIELFLLFTETASLHCVCFCISGGP